MPVVVIDGRPVTVSDEEAGQLGRLGHQRETTEQAAGRAQETAAETFFTSPGQQVAAGLEGLASGATIGISDILMDDEETRQRARRNPGIRLAGELTGAIGSAVLSGGTGALGTVAKLTPSALAARAGVGASKALGRGSVTALGIEGAIQGAGTAASTAVLRGDPLTVEALAAGAGMGTLFGAGLGVLAKGVGAAGRASERHLASLKTEAAEAALSKEVPALKRVSASLEEITTAAKRAVGEVEGALTPAALQSRLKGLVAAAETMALDLPGLSGEVGKRARAALTAARSEMRAARAAIQAKNPELAQEALASYEGLLNRAASHLGSSVPVPTQAIKNLADLTETAALGRLPATPAALVGTADDYFPRLQKAITPAGDELDTLRASALEDIDATLRDAGLAPASMNPEDVVNGLREYRDMLRESVRVTKRTGTGHKTTSLIDFFRKAASQSAARGASVAGRHVANSGPGAAILSSVMYQGAGRLVGALVGELSSVRAAAVSHVEQLVARVGPKGEAGLKRLAPVSEILRRPLTGDRDGRKPDRTNREAARDRIQEAFQLAPSIPDIAYAVSEPVMEASPETALMLAKQLTTGFQHIVAAAPKVPQGTNVGLKSDWLPSEGQSLQLASVLEAVCTPMDSLDRMLQGDGDPAAANALWAVYPSLMQEAAVRLLERLPVIQDKMDFPTRTALSTAFRVPLDGLLTKESVAALQAQFVPLPRDPEAGKGSGGPGGRPPATSNMPTPEQTRAQFLTGR